jgi:cardiolipin synthase
MPGRVTFVVLAILIQLAWLFCGIFYASNATIYGSYFLKILSMVAIVHILNGSANPSVKIAWIVPIALFPIFGGVIYVLFGIPHMPSNKKYLKNKERLEKISKESRFDDSKNLQTITSLDAHIGGQFRYLSNRGFPVSNCSFAEYFPLGENNFPAILSELKKAKHFIFMEYFIIEEGEMWGEILQILEEKAAAGLDVRLIYDDIGCMLKLPKNYDKLLESKGISCIAFNKFKPFLSIVMNNRDHRKITVIDGSVGFTGGINLADEYINRNSKFGHWKDTGIMISGQAVQNLTILFLNQWNNLRPTDSDFSFFLPTCDLSLHPDGGFIQPYGDSPLDQEFCAENVYLNIIYGAKRYLYIFTPYLIADNETVSALSLAAKRGVDVRIMTPGIPDKKIVNQLTKSYYPELIKQGVKIYEYTPGFVHAKSFVCDDEIATVGSINLDFRSLYLHFECGCLLYKNKIIAEIKNDFEETLKNCQPVLLKKSIPNIFQSVYYAALRLFSPLL